MTNMSGPETLARHGRWLNRKARKQGRLPSLFFVTDESRTPDPISIVRELPSKTAVILRHYGHPQRDILARDLARACRKRGLLFFVAGSASLAREVHADGLHLPEWQISKLAGYGRDKRLRFVTASVHDLPTLIKAGNLGASAVLASPVFATASHPERPHLGTTKLANFVRVSSVPVYALGGVSERNSTRLIGTGAAGIAGISAFLSQPRMQCES